MREQDGWDEHAAFMDGLVDDGFILLGGPLEGDRDTLHAVRATSEEAVRERLAADPWAASGHLKVARVERWTILLDGGLASSTSLESLQGSLMHLRPGSPYSELWREAAALTSTADTERNQRIKYTRMAGLFGALQPALERGLRADVAECGCFRGQSAYVMARMLEAAGFAGELLLFDSFQGLSEFSPADTEGYATTAEQLASRRRHFVASEADVRALFSPFDFVEIFAGWIPERFDEVKDRRFEIVHVDVDLYQPTRDSIEFFWPLLIEGGIVVVDDYNVPRFPGATKAVDEFVARTPNVCSLPQQVGGILLLKTQR
jgi:O-methyltransferase